MGMKGSFYMGALAIALLWGGGQGVYTAATNRQPTSYDFETYLSDRPQDKWLTLSDTQLDLTQATYSQTRFIGTVREAYIPVFSATDEGRDSIDVVIQTKDKTMIQTIQAIEEAFSQNNKASLDYIAKNQDKIFPEDDISGLVMYGIEVDDDTRIELNDLYGDVLADDFVFIEEGARPKFLVSGAFFTVGIALLGLLLKPFLLQQSKEIET